MIGSKRWHTYWQWKSIKKQQYVIAMTCVDFPHNKTQSSSDNLIHIFRELYNRVSGANGILYNNQSERINVSDHLLTIITIV